MNLSDATALRIGGKDAIEARLNGQVVWTAAVNPPSDLVQAYIDNHFSAAEYGGVYTSNPVEVGQQRLWQDAAMTVPAAQDGDRVYVREDLSGNGLHQVAASDTARVTLRYQNGLYYLQGNGSNQRLSIPSADSIPRSATGFLMAVGVSRTQGGDAYRVHQYSSSNSARVFSTNEFTASASSYRFSVQVPTSYSEDRVAVVTAPAEPHVLICRWKGAGTFSEAAINKGAFASGSATSPEIPVITQDIEVGGYLDNYPDAPDFGLILRSAWSQQAEDDALELMALLTLGAVIEPPLAMDTTGVSIDQDFDSGDYAE